jgi:hypothetical protein
VVELEREKRHQKIFVNFVMIALLLCLQVVVDLKKIDFHYNKIFAQLNYRICFKNIVEQTFRIVKPTFQKTFLDMYNSVTPGKTVKRLLVKVQVCFTCLTIACETSPFLSALKTSSSVAETIDRNSALPLFKYGTKNYSGKNVVYKFSYHT